MQCYLFVVSFSACVAAAVAYDDTLCVLDPLITIPTRIFTCETQDPKSAIQEILNQNVLQEISAARERENAFMGSMPAIVGHTSSFGHSISVSGEGIRRNELVHRGIHLQRLMTSWEEAQE